jgi:hypothetical protein
VTVTTPEGKDQVMAIVVTDFLAHQPGEFIAEFGDGVTGYFGQTFIAQASNLTQIEFELDPFLAFGAGTTDYTVMVASVTSAPGSFHPDQVLFQSAPLTFTTDGDELNWQPVSVAVSGLNLTAGRLTSFC